MPKGYTTKNAHLFRGRWLTNALKTPSNTILYARIKIENKKKNVVSKKKIT